MTNSEMGLANLIKNIEEQTMVTINNRIAIVLGRKFTKESN